MTYAGTDIKWAWLVVGPSKNFTFQQTTHDMAHCDMYSHVKINKHNSWHVRVFSVAIDDGDDEDENQSQNHNQNHHHHLLHLHFHHHHHLLHRHFHLLLHHHLHLYLKYYHHFPCIIANLRYPAKNKFFAG